MTYKGKWNWYGYNNNPKKDENKTQQQLQVQEQITLLVSAYDKKVAHKLFRNSLEWAEKYVEVVHPNYQIRRQVDDKNIKRQDANDPNRVKRLFSSVLFGFKSTMEIIKGDKQSKQSLYDEIKKEYYEWLGATGINPNNCPAEFKHFLFEINEILEGRGDKLEREIENRKWEIDPNSAEYEQAFNNLFTNVQIPLDNERNEYENLKGKNHKDIKVGNDFGGNSELAEQAFKKMAGRHDYQGFNFIQQKDVRSSLQEQSSSSFQQRPNSVIVRNIEQNPEHWRFDEVSVYGIVEKKMALVHHSVLDEVVDLSSQPVYLPEKFNRDEINRINQALNISQTTSTNQTIRWDLVNSIKQRINEFKVEKIIVPNENGGYEEEDWIIHNSVERKSGEKGSLIFDSNNMFKVKDLTKAEQKELGIQHSDQVYQVQTQTDNNHKGGGKGGFGGYGNSILWGSFSVISLIGLAFTKTK